MRRFPLIKDVPFPTAPGLVLSAALLLLTSLLAASASAQSLEDLLGGSDSPLVPSDQVEPELTVTLTPDGPLEEGAILTLAVRAELGPGAYTYSQNPSFGGSTKIKVTELYGLEAMDEVFTPDHPPKVAFEELFGQEVEKFPGSVTWTRRYRYTGNVPTDHVYLTGTIAYQVCDDRNCRPLQEEFEVFPELPADSSATTPAAVAQTPKDEGSSGARPAGGPPVENEQIDEGVAVPAAGSDEEELALEFNLGTRADEASLPAYLLMAFLGGLILNIMPCVLPVLAIKVMSFVQQAGESRGRVLALNISYAFGVVAVFLVLASLAVTLKIGWGGLFQRPEFNLAMIGLVFAMGLSMLGVFEIPIPGMIGSAGGQHREGLLGAFLIGIFATLLATPCSGPLMTTVLAWSVKQEPTIVYLVWGVMGLGMASPFLIVGLVPALARFIPRPGDWMVRFKEFSGFALLAAALWLMNSLPSEVILPTMIMLLGLGLGLWMIGSLYDHSTPLGRKLVVRGAALLVVALIGWFGFEQYTTGQALAEARRSMPVNVAMDPADDDDRTARIEPTHSSEGGELPWETFSGERLMELLREGKPVLIDFTADWCLICKQNEKIALNTEATNEFVRKHGVVTLYADYTRSDPEIQEWLERFNSISVPLTVIFPEGDPQNPIILDGPYTQSTLLAELQQAVPSAEVAADERQSARVDTTSR